jgi:hypothetical protein
MGDFNLALDDSYQGRVVKGCPAYEEVRQTSMNSFDLNKFQGLWYEQKFHDWTQFKEVYDTTLGIKVRLRKNRTDLRVDTADSRLFPFSFGSLRRAAWDGWMTLP